MACDLDTLIILVILIVGAVLSFLFPIAIAIYRLNALLPGWTVKNSACFTQSVAMLLIKQERTPEHFPGHDSQFISSILYRCCFFILLFEAVLFLSVIKYGSIFISVTACSS
jgi:hypothetical protein